MRRPKNVTGGLNRFRPVETSMFVPPIQYGRQLSQPPSGPSDKPDCRPIPGQTRVTKETVKAKAGVRELGCQSRRPLLRCPSHRARAPVNVCGSAFAMQSIESKQIRVTRREHLIDDCTQTVMNIGTPWPLKRLYKFVLKRIIGRFLLGELDLDQLDVQLGTGVLELNNLAVNTAVLNDALKGLPFVCTAGYIDTVKATIPWKSLISRNCKIEVSSLELTLVPSGHEPEYGNASGYSMRSSVISGAAGSVYQADDVDDEDIDLDESFIAEAKKTRDKKEENDESAGIEVLARLIERVLAKIEVVIHSLRIRVCYKSPSTGKCVTLLCTLPSLSYCDESHEKNGAFTSSLRNKTIRLRGFKVEVLEHDSCEEAMLEPAQELDESVTTPDCCILRCEPQNDDCLTVKYWSRGRQPNTPKLEGSLFVRSVDMIVTPAQFSLISGLLDAVSDDHGGDGEAGSGVFDPTGMEASALGMQKSLQARDFGVIESLLMEYGEASGQHMSASALSDQFYDPDEAPRGEAGAGEAPPAAPGDGGVNTDFRFKIQVQSVCAVLAYRPDEGLPWRARAYDIIQEHRQVSTFGPFAKRDSKPPVTCGFDHSIFLFYVVRSAIDVADTRSTVDISLRTVDMHEVLYEPTATPPVQSAVSAGLDPSPVPEEEMTTFHDPDTMENSAGADDVTAYGHPEGLVDSVVRTDGTVADEGGVNLAEETVSSHGGDTSEGSPVEQEGPGDPTADSTRVGSPGPNPTIVPTAEGAAHASEDAMPAVTDGERVGVESSLLAISVMSIGDTPRPRGETPGGGVEPCSPGRSTSRTGSTINTELAASDGESEPSTPGSNPLARSVMFDRATASSLYQSVAQANPGATPGDASMMESAVSSAMFHSAAGQSAMFQSAVGSTASQLGGQALVEDDSEDLVESSMGALEESTTIPAGMQNGSNEPTEPAPGVNASQEHAVAEGATFLRQSVSVQSFRASASMQSLSELTAPYAPREIRRVFKFNNLAQWPDADGAQSVESSPSMSDSMREGTDAHVTISVVMTKSNETLLEQSIHIGTQPVVLDLDPFFFERISCFFVPPAPDAKPSKSQPGPGDGRGPRGGGGGSIFDEIERNQRGLDESQSAPVQASHKFTLSTEQLTATMRFPTYERDDATGQYLTDRFRDEALVLQMFSAEVVSVSEGERSAAEGSLISIKGGMLTADMVNESTGTSCRLLSAEHSEGAASDRLRIDITTRPSLDRDLAYRDPPMCVSEPGSQMPFSDGFCSSGYEAMNKSTMEEAKMERMAFENRAVESARVFVALVIPKADLAISHYNLHRLSELIPFFFGDPATYTVEAYEPKADLGARRDTEYYPCQTSGGFDDASSVYSGVSARSGPAPGRGPGGSNMLAQSAFALTITCAEGKAIMSEGGGGPSNHVFTLDVKDLQVFQVDGYFGTPVSYWYVGMGELIALDSTTESSALTPVLFRTPVVKDISLPPSFSMTILQKLNKPAKLIDSTVSLDFFGMTLKFLKDNSWLGAFVNFLFTPPPEVVLPPVPVTYISKLFVNAQECLVDYAPEELPSRAVVTVGKLRVTTTIVPGAPTSTYVIKLEDGRLYLIDDVAYMRRPQDELSMVEEQYSVQEYLDRAGFVRVVGMDFMEMFICARTEGGMPEMEVEVTNNQMTLYTHHDSFEVLVALVGHLTGDSSTPDSEGAQASAGEPEEEQGSAQPVVAPQPSGVTGADGQPVDSESGLVGGLGRNILDMVDDDAFRPKSKGSQNNEDEPKMGGVVIDDYYHAERGIDDGEQTDDVVSEEEDGGVPEPEWIVFENRNLTKGGDLDADERDEEGGDEQGHHRRQSTTASIARANAGDAQDGKWVSEGPSIIDDHVPLPTKSTRKLHLKPSGTYPSVIVTRVAVRDFNVAWRLLGGSSWGSDQLGDEEGPGATAAPEPEIAAPAEETFREPLEAERSDEDDARGPVDEEVALGAGERDSQPDATPDDGSSVGQPGGTPAAPDSEPEEEDGRTYEEKLHSLRDYFMAGERKPKKKRMAQRHNNNSMEVVLRSINLELHVFPRTEQFARSLSLSIGDLEVLDGIKTSHIAKFLSYYNTTPRESGSCMMRLLLESVRPVPSLPAEENRLKLSFLPLRFNIDQDALEFLKKFFMSASPADSDGPGAPQEALEDDAAPFFQICECRAVDIRIDYKPKRVDIDSLRQSNFIELMNLFPMNGVELTLKRARLSGVRGWGLVIESLLMSWVMDISSSQIHRALAGVQPFRSLVNIGGGVADLVVIPAEHYKRDRRLIRGIRKGSSSFLRTAVREALTLSSNVTMTAQNMLQQADMIISGTSAAPDTGSRRADQPENVAEGLYQAYESLSKGIRGAAGTIIAIPIEDSSASGQQTTHNAIRAAPVVVLRPLIGLTEAMSKTILGVRNTIDPSELARDAEKYKHKSR